MKQRDHGGGLDAAVAQYGGRKEDWIDLSTGINPRPFPIPELSSADWMALPDRAAVRRLVTAARSFWKVPDGAEIVPAPGASALIATIPGLWPASSVTINQPTYNEHEFSFRNWGWSLSDAADSKVVVNPNNPDGRFWNLRDLGKKYSVIDESFCDMTPRKSLITASTREGVIVLKSFGKFWGLAGLRLGFAICLPELAQTLRDRLGPWNVSGPALTIGASALEDHAWADATRKSLKEQMTALDDILKKAGLQSAGGTDLFRLVSAPDAEQLKKRLCHSGILVRTFPYSKTLVRFGLPKDGQGLDRLRSAVT